MDPKAVKQALAALCEDLDAGRTMRRPAFALPAALIAGMGMTFWSGCDEAVALYAAVGPREDSDTASVDVEADCANEVDDDADGLVDCYDDDCEGDPACAADMYRAP